MSIEAFHCMYMYGVLFYYDHCPNINICLSENPLLEDNGGPL